MSEYLGLGRRDFYRKCIYGLWGLISGALALPAAAYLLSPPGGKSNDEWVDAGNVDSLPVNIPQEVVFRRTHTDGWKVTSEKTSAWVVKGSAQDVVAFAPQCTHLGCAYHWDEQNHDFLCPCHNSTFAIDGGVLGGPAPRPLDRFQVKITGGKLLLGRIEKPVQGA